MISFVVAVRNDNYGGDFLLRFQFFLYNLYYQWEKYKINAELVVVEWNPPADKKRIVDEPINIKNGPMRIITVPAEIHRTLPNANRTPMFEYLAKNVGVRRAKGEFILVTNPDILFSDNLMAYLSKNLKPDEFYRVDRYDLGKELSWGQCYMELPPKRALCDDRNIHECQQCQCANSIETWHTLGKSLKLNRHIPCTALQKAYARFDYWARYNASTLLGRQSPNGSVLNKIHTNASGDFILMSTEAWNNVRGFPEFATMSHLDAYVCVMAHVLGLEQVILPYEIYHQKHNRSNSPRPMTEFTKWQKDCEDMIMTGKLNVRNGEGWGLGNVELEEETR